MRKHAAIALIGVGLASIVGCGGGGTSDGTLSIPSEPAILGTHETLQVWTEWGRVTDGVGYESNAPNATWTSSDPSIATVTLTDAGKAANVEAVGEGTATITAELDGQAATMTVHVAPSTLTAIEVTPATPQVALGTTQQLHATGTFSDGTTSDVTELVLWVSSSEGVSVDSGSTHGLVEPHEAGTSDITAIVVNGTDSLGFATTISASTTITVP